MYKLSIIAYAEENYKLDNLLNSISKQEEIEDLSCVQVIVADAGTTEYNQKFFATAKSGYEFDIDYVSCPGENIAKCYNKALKNVKGEYVAFMDVDSELSALCFKKILNTLENEEIENQDKQYICIKPAFVRSEGEEVVYKVYPNAGGVRNIDNSTQNVNLCLYSYFIKTSLIADDIFNEEFPIESRQLFILNLMEKCSSYYCINSQTILYYHALEDVPSFFVAQHSKEWYTYTMQHCYLPYVKEHYEQGKMTWQFETAIIYLIYTRFSCNMNEANKDAISGEEIDEFYSVVYEILKYLRYDVIIQRKRVKGCTLPTWLVWKFMNNKAKLCGNESELIFSGGNFMLDINEEEESRIPCKYKLFAFQQRMIKIYAINYENNQLIIDFALPAMPIDWLEYVTATARGADVEDREVYNITKCFGQIVAQENMYRAASSLKKKEQKIYFRVNVLERAYHMPLTFAKPASRLQASVKENYWLFNGNCILKYDAFAKELQITRCSKNELMCLEANYALAIKHNDDLINDEKQEIISLRKKYWEHYFNKNENTKPIWITFDKLYKAGDNGEYIYHYIRKNCPEIDMYYIIDEEAADYERLKDDDHVLLHKSAIAKEMALKASVILATHVNTMVYCGFTSANERKYLRNLYNGEIVCIQHGLTVQDIAVYQNVLYDNTRLYCCASKYEVENILQPVYGYEENQVKLDGLARYDGLVNNDKKQILITPTWRRDIVNGGVACNKKSYNEYFKHSEYYKLYNSLINDEKLISYANKYGYKIIYLLHPAMSSQIDDYDTNEYVELMAATGNMSYEKILTESSLMVTDYSGVQFDFAYMRKPILYYHPDTLPPHYQESSAFRYETMGFGPIITNHQELVNQICSYMENECKMQQQYKERADDFFAFDDTNSCERIYKDVKAFADRITEGTNRKIKEIDALDYSDLEIQLRETKKKLEECENKVKYMENSPIWKAGAPLRKVQSVCKNLTK